MLVGMMVCAVGVATTRPAGISADELRYRQPRRGPGHLRVPIGWTVTRITAGPGSRRVEIVSPTDDSAALHVTQSYTPEETLDGAAQVLRRALAKETAGAFVEFNPV